LKSPMPPPPIPTTPATPSNDKSLKNYPKKSNHLSTPNPHNSLPVSITSLNPTTHPLSISQFRINAQSQKNAHANPSNKSPPKPTNKFSPCQ
jgi:hypothetical protein